MARRVFRILLILALAVLAGVTGWQVWSLDRTRTSQRADAERLQRDALRATQAILDLRASQRAYLSPGQGIAAWKPRVDAHLASLREQFHALREQASALPSSSAAAAAQADDEALDTLVAARYLEQRIADHVTAGRFQHAADLVYADGVTVSLKLERAANAAFTAHAQELQAGRTRVQWTEGALLGLAAAIGFVLALLVMPARQARGEAASEAGTTAGDATADRDRTAGDVAAAGAVGTTGAVGTAGAAGVAGAAGAAGAAARTSGVSGRRGEPAVRGLGLASGGRSAGASAGTAGAGGGPSPAAASRGGPPATGAGRATPAVAATGRNAPAPPDVPMADDLPLHAPVAAFPANAAQSAHATSRGAAEGSAMATSASAGSGTPVRQTPPAAGATDGGAAAAGSTGSAAATPAASGLAVQTDDGMLAAAADLTGAVARVGDIDGLKPVMARLADHLDAVGLIVWLEDASTERLTPIVTHGYPAETLAHLRPIELDADNATARAWRLAELQIVPSRGPQPGAIVVPMPSSAGCVGVIAAEVRHGREHDAATLDLARILAAQLAMLTGSRG